MRLLEERIRRDGVILGADILRVDSFLNHQMDIDLFTEMGKEFYRLFGADNVTKILTIEASGIGMACVIAQSFHCPVLFAKKSKTSNVEGGVYTATVKSYTHNRVYDVLVSKDYLKPEDRILIIDDFLANGEAITGLASLVKQAGATLVGAGVAVEKAFQQGGDKLRASGMRIEALARIASMDEINGVRFVGE